VTRLTSLIEQTLRNASSEGPSNQSITFFQIATTTQLEERMDEHGQEPQHNPASVQATTPTPTPAIVNAFSNKSCKTKSSDGIDQDKMATLEVRIMAIEGVDLYNPVQPTKKCLILNMVVATKFHVPEFIKYTRTQCPMTHLKSFCNKIAEVVHNKKLLMNVFQDSLSDTKLS